MRLKWRGIEASICNLSLGEKFEQQKYDIIFLGGGQDYEQEILKNDLLSDKGPYLKEAVENGTTFLCICGGYQIMGNYYVTSEGIEIPYLGAVDIYTVADKKRMIGNLIFTSPLIENSVSNRNMIVGFENHSGKTFLGKNVTALGTVLKGYGNNGCDKTEGAVYKNVICSYSHGSLLPKNPYLTDFILCRALSGKYSEFTPEDFPLLNNSFEDNARISMLSRYHIV
jgi:CobQ-like glutamine amidotransferase family enzyme